MATVPGKPTEVKLECICEDKKQCWNRNCASLKKYYYVKDVVGTEEKKMLFDSTMIFKWDALAQALGVGTLVRIQAAANLAPVVYYPILIKILSEQNCTMRDLTRAMENIAKGMYDRLVHITTDTVPPKPVKPAEE